MIMARNQYLAAKGLVVLLTLAVCGCSKTPDNKAQEFMDAGMYEQAKVVLSSAVEANPTNPKLHFMLGQCFLAAGEPGQAQQAFDRATRLEPDYGKMIGKAYYDQGIAAVNDREREILFLLAARYDPSTKPATAAFYANAAIANLSSTVDQVERSAELAVSYDPAVGREIAAAILKKAKEESLGSRSLQHLEALSLLAVRLDPSNEGAWARLFFGWLTRDLALSDPETALSIGAAADARDPSLRKEIADLYMETAKAALSLSPIDSDLATRFFGASIDLQGTEGPELLKLCGLVLM